MEWFGDFNIHERFATGDAAVKLAESDEGISDFSKGTPLKEE